MSNLKQSSLKKTPRREKPNKGFILVVVLVAVAFLTLIGYTFLERMTVEDLSSRLTGRQLQTQSIADSAIEEIKRFLAEDPQLIVDSGGIYDNPEYFQGQLVIDDEDPQYRARYAVIAPSMDPFTGVYEGNRFGLENESARLNLNALIEIDKLQEGSGQSILMGLPGMTEPIADAIDFVPRRLRN